MLSKQPAELSLSDAQAVGEPIDTAFIEYAGVESAPTPSIRHVPHQAANSDAVSGRQRRRGRRPYLAPLPAVA